MGLDRLLASFLLHRAAHVAQVAVRPRSLLACPLGVLVSGA